MRRMSCWAAMSLLCQEACPRNAPSPLMMAPLSSHREKAHPKARMEEKARARIPAKVRAKIKEEEIKANLKAKAKSYHHLNGGKEPGQTPLGFLGDLDVYSFWVV